MRSISAFTGLVLLAMSAGGAAAQTPGLEAKLCPARVLYAYPLAPGTRFQSLVVPDLALFNHGDAAAELTEVTFELLDKGVVVDSRRLAGEALKSAGKGGSAAQLQMGLFPFQFCDGRLMGEHPRLSASDSLAGGTVGLVANQTFGW